MSELVNNLKKIVTTFKADSVLIEQAAKRIEQLESNPSISAELQEENDNLRRDLALERQKVTSARKAEDEANEIIAKIAKAAECENFADIILARVEAQNQQSNAMTRICEGHIANCRKAENAKARLNQNLSLVQNERDDARGQLQARCDLLHEIADALNGPVNTCRDAIPAKDWFMEKIEERVASRSYRRHLDVIGEAVGKPGLSYKDLAEYFRGLNVEGLKKIADKANEAEAERAKLAGELADALRGLEARSITLGQLAVALGVSQMEDGWATKMLNKANATEAERRKLAGKLADAERYVEARDITLQQIASALKVDQSKEGWATTMINTAEHYRHEFFSKDRKWDKEKTDALQACLSKLGYWPEWNNVDGLRKLTAHVFGLRQELKEWQERSIEKNNYISKLEHGYSPDAEELKLAHESIKRLEVHVREANVNYEEAKKGHAEACESRDATRRELDLAVGAIKRMHAKLIEYKEKTGIWPADGKFRAKLDDIEWCLNVYIGRAVADQQLHEADTMFIAQVRDSLSHEILRRNMP